MQYQSTRGHGPVSFNQVLADGLAPDGGLYLPVDYPQISPDQQKSFQNKSYKEIAFDIIYPYVSEEYGSQQLKDMLDEAYANFDTAEITPLKRVSENCYFLELFHGPTLAFKDVALQLLGLFYEALLKKSDSFKTVLGATSGDTGPAAIEGLKQCDDIRIYMLYPYGRISDIQRKQMTTVTAKNVIPVAVEGSFDDCQRLVKDAFADVDFRKEMHLTAVNSISWARLLPQIVYYFYAQSRLNLQQGQVPHFVVPTGNFGDIFAGFVARYMGLEADFTLAANQNDILSRLVNNNDYSQKEVIASQSPSIDIQIASNFERYLFELNGRDAQQTAQMMHDFKQTGLLKLPTDTYEQLRLEVSAAAISEAETTKTITNIYKKHGYVIDPHTAVAVKAAKKLKLKQMVCLATAHPGKFPKAVAAAINIFPDLPQKQQHILQKEERFVKIAPELTALKELMRQ